MCPSEWEHLIYIDRATITETSNRELTQITFSSREVHLNSHSPKKYPNTLWSGGCCLGTGAPGGVKGWCWAKLCLARSRWIHYGFRNLEWHCGCLQPVLPAVNLCAGRWILLQAPVQDMGKGDFLWSVKSINFICLLRRRQKDAAEIQNKFTRTQGLSTCFMWLWPEVTQLEWHL